MKNDSTHLDAAKAFALGEGHDDSTTARPLAPVVDTDAPTDADVMARSVFDNAATLGHQFNPSLYVVPRHGLVEQADANGLGDDRQRVGDEVNGQTYGPVAYMTFSAQPGGIDPLNGPGAETQPDEGASSPASDIAPNPTDRRR